MGASDTVLPPPIITAADTVTGFAARLMKLALLSSVAAWSLLSEKSKTGPNTDFPSAPVMRTPAVDHPPVVATAGVAEPSKTPLILYTLLLSSPTYATLLS